MSACFGKVFTEKKLDAYISHELIFGLKLTWT